MEIKKKKKIESEKSERKATNLPEDLHVKSAINLIQSDREHLPESTDITPMRYTDTKYT